ncbi:MAG TPA: OB-fold nucleic acid binding domain-containing protein, partial [Clostridia bacterium]|nr:OB-fold nucleic acid binding domain-containing protein [Clostridia bacterium]
MAELLQGWKRTSYCADVKAEDVGKEVLLMGWSGTWRNLGSLIFIGLRDRTGVMQVVFNESFTPKNVFELGETIRSEYVIAVKGILARRAPEMVNKDMATGEYELHAT